LERSHGLRAAIDYGRVTSPKVYGIGANDEHIGRQPRENLGGIRGIKRESHRATWRRVPIARDWRNRAISEQTPREKATIHAEAEVS
jgi:hypothetical protein